LGISNSRFIFIYLPFFSQYFQGFDIQQFGREYFAIYKVCLYPDRYGLKTWGDLLTHAKVKPFCEIFNNGLSARYRNPAAPPPSVSTNQKLQQMASGNAFNGPSGSGSGRRSNSIKSVKMKIRN
jgi:hypothetical protein